MPDPHHSTFLYIHIYIYIYLYMYIYICIKILSRLTHSTHHTTHNHTTHNTQPHDNFPRSAKKQEVPMSIWPWSENRSRQLSTANLPNEIQTYWTLDTGHMFICSVMATCRSTMTSSRSWNRSRTWRVYASRIGTQELTCSHVTCQVLKRCLTISLMIPIPCEQLSFG
jgi:hypothetical protein